MTRGGLALFVVALLLSTPAARTAPLDKEGCAKLKAEEAQLEQSGIRASMSRGPEWAKTNLPSDKLEQIRRLIEVEEQLLFRCHGKPLVNLPQDPDPDPAARGEAEAKEGTAGAKAAKAAKQPKKKAAAAKQAPGEGKADAPAKAEAAKAAATKAPAPPKAAAPAKQAKDAEEKPVVAKAAKKAKAKDDAYRPPPAGTEPGSNPFARQQ